MELKYTKELLEEAVRNSHCITDVVRFLKNEKYIHGAKFDYIKKKIISFNIDITHFLSRSEIQKLRGNKLGNGNKRKANEILKNNTVFHTYQLRRALIEKGIEYKCNKCNNTNIWQNENLVLEVNHINGIKTDNRLKNLEFLCPNCHSQTSNFRSKNHGRQPAG